MLAEQQKLRFMNTVQKLDAVLKTCQERWLIGTDGEWDPRNFEQFAGLHNDNHDDGKDALFKKNVITISLLSLLYGMNISII